MRRIIYPIFFLIFLLTAFASCKNSLQTHGHEALDKVDNDEGEDEGYDGPAERDRFEFERIKDPKLGYVPMEKMLEAVQLTEDAKVSMMRRGLRTAALNWVERGPIYDSVGPSNGNLRGPSRTTPNTYTSGRTRAILIDTLNDPTGNTVFCGSVAGGLWKCTNFLSTTPNWQHNSDRFDNLAISYICQDPSNPSIMYFSTGEPTANVDAVSGLGLWRSTDAGSTWTRLPSTSNLVRTFRIACDGVGNLFAAERTITAGLNNPVIQTIGLLRSKDHGDTWEDITPSNLTSSNATCTDIEISSTGRLHASFGYATSGTTNKVQHVYTTTPATVTSATWNTSTGIRSSGLYSLRLELAAVADTLYGVTVNSASNLDSIYKSIDGGATWTKQNSTVPTSGVLSGQAWYSVTLAINPSNSNEFMVGGLDAYKFSNSGTTTPVRMTYWVSSAPYVHADHHFMQWWNAGTQSRIVIGCDGGVFLSNDGGATFQDRNRNLAIKQFYDVAIHPAQGSNYMIAGAQDNGSHQFKNPGLSYTTEVTGGDGAFVHISQQNPQIQFTTYVYNQYRRSVDGGATWTPINLSSTNGAFINQYDYDGGQNILYASWANGTTPQQILRWKNANVSATDTSILTITPLTSKGVNNNSTAFKVSPYKRDRVFIGGDRGAIVRLDNASTVTNATVSANATNITGANFDNGYISCVNVGSSDNFLVATFSSYGVKHVWFSENGGTSWTNIDGTLGSGGLPNMPVRWAVFDPQSNYKLIIATEAGVYSTDNINGANTIWTADINFPTVRTDRLALRLSDNTIAAATHGRGVFTAVLASTPEVRFSAPFATIGEATTSTAGCRNYKDYTVDVSMISAPTGDATVTYSVKSDSTASEGKDFDFTTNGDFSALSKQQVFSSGVATTKNITIRVYDDAEVEGPETFTITFNVSGSTNAISGSANTFTITINDNDAGPSLPAAATQSVTVGSLAFPLTYASGSYNGTAPLDQRSSSRRSQILYKASELLSAGLKPGNINSFQLYMTHATGVRGYSNFTVKMGLTSRDNLVDGNQLYTIPTTTVKNAYTFTPTVSTNGANNTITLDAPFSWDGLSSIVVELCYNNSTADSSGTLDRTWGYADGSSNIQGNMIWQDNIDCSSSFNASSSNFNYFSLGQKPRIVFAESYTTGGTLAATTLNSAKTEYFVTGSPANDFYYYLPTGEVLAKFKNTSMFNYGCTQVIIDRAGVGISRFWNDTDSSTFLMTKTYRVIPTTNNSAGTYEATFYFSAAEKQAWENGTKQSFNNIKVIKVPGQISAVTPSNHEPDGPGTVQIITPTAIGTIGNNYYITATFNNGFSGFGFGIPTNTALPITLLNFTGKLQGDNSLLSWSTSSEQNTNHFDVEKSLDGINYHKIGEVRAAGSSNASRSYSFLDKEFALDKNYYRLNTVDNDSRNRISDIVILRNVKNQQNLTVVNNPFRDFIDVRLGKVPQGRVKLQLADLSGKVLLTQTFNALSQNILRLNTSRVISQGVYILSAEIDGTRYSAKVMKQ
jgi:trimeric autotransporter adhesin